MKDVVALPQFGCSADGQARGASVLGCSGIAIGSNNKSPSLLPTPFPITKSQPVLNVKKKYKKLTIWVAAPAKSKIFILRK